MDVSVKDVTAPGEGSKFSPSIPPLLHTDGPLNPEPTYSVDSKAPSTPLDTESLLAGYLFSLHRLTQSESFSLPIYLLGANGRCTVKTLYFIAGETLHQTRSRVRRRLETPGHPLGENSGNASDFNAQVSFSIALFDGTTSAALPEYIIDRHRNSESAAMLLVDGPVGGELSGYAWLHRFPQDGSNPMQAVIPYLDRLINITANEPAADIYRLNLLSDSELSQQKSFESDTQESIQHIPVVRQFEIAVEEGPLRPAIFSDGNSFSYRALNNLCNLIATKLLSKGVTDKCYVGVMVNPSAELLACVLAIHKIGAIYVPLDATFPEARLRSILEVAPTSQILYEANTQEIVKNLGMPSLSVSGLTAEAIEAPDIPNPGCEVSIDSASHIFFTSGTTGAPKGILATHRNFAHSLYAGIKRYGFAQHDRFVAIARSTFSISMFEYFTALTLGAPVRILTRATVSNPAELASAIKTATVVHMVPSLLRQLLDYFDNQDGLKVPDIRHLLTGGDMVPPEILKRSINAFPRARIFVNYGSSEISCMGCTYEIDRTSTTIRTKVGKPHPNMKVRILDSHKNPIPVGLCGELYFSGDGVVPGYLNRPDLNQKKFADIDGDRYFAIGDIGRFDHHGNIELLGREDFQVQINGIRIEPPEVEGRLKQLTQVKDCVVVGRTIGSSNQASLVAYLVLNQPVQTAKEISAYLAEDLPEYMCPSVYVVLPKLPTNHNGKIDRSQLPTPSIDNILSAESSGDATTPLQRELIAIWENSFELEGLHPDHDFFEIGGTSLKAISMLAHIRDRFNREIPLAHFLANRTVRKFARVISSHNQVDQDENITVLKDGDPAQPALFCLNGSVQYRELATTIDIPNRVAAVTLREEEAIISDSAQSEAFSAISDFSRVTEKYLQAIIKFQPRGPYFLTGASFGGLIAFEVARCLLKKGEKVALIGLYDTWIPGYRDKARPLKRIEIGLSKIRKSGMQQIRSYGSRFLNSLTRQKRKPDLIDETTDIRALLRATALSTYKLKALDHSIVLFNAIDRPRFYGEPDQPHLGWKRYARSVEVCKVPGDHTGILKYPNVQHVARRLETLFAEQAIKGLDRINLSTRHPIFDEQTR